MFKGLAVITLIISALLMFVRLVSTIRLNYLISVLVFYLLFAIHTSPTALFVFKR